jgi:hypothetical protein
MFKAEPGERATRLSHARRWVNSNPAQVLVLCIACVLVLMTVLTVQRPASKQLPTHEWFYDSATGQLVPEPSGTLPPVKVGEGELWRAQVYSCGGCEDAFIGYFEKLTPEAKRQLEQLNAAAAKSPWTLEQEQEVYDLHMTGSLCSLDGREWRPKEEVEERFILHVTSRCPSRANWCFPGPGDL